MSLPTFSLEAAFASDPMAAVQTYTDLRALLDRFNWQHGRQREGDEGQPGTLGATLIDEDGDLDPDNAAGAHYPNVRPGRRVRSRATLNAVTYDVFQAFVDPEEGWQQDWVNPGYAAVTVSAKDAIDLLAAQNPPTSTIAGQASGAFVNAVLDLIGWPAALRAVDAGLSTVAAVADASQQSALALLRRAEATERGFLFVARDGKVTFHSRSRRLHPQPLATFCDAPNWQPGRILVSRLLPRTSRILNDWRVRQGDTEYERGAEDSTSIARHGRRTGTVTIYSPSSGPVSSTAEWELLRRKDPHRRFELLLVPGVDDQIWQQVLARELGDAIRLIATPPGADAPVDVVQHIDWKTLSWGPTTRAEARWLLAPADENPYFILDDAAYALDGNGMLAL